MPDITSLYLELTRSVKEKGKLSGPQLYVSHKSDIFTRECLKVNGTIHQLATYLEGIRGSYLAMGKRIVANHGRRGSTSSHAPTSLTDKQRDEIDYETKMIIQQTMMKIRSLEDLEKERLERESKKGGAFSSFFVDVKQEEINKTIALHRAGILWSLNDSLKDVSARYSAQQEIRLSRQMEKSKSMLHNVDESTSLATTNTLRAQAKLPLNPYTSGEAGDNELPEILRDLSPQQITELESENNALLDELELSLNKAQAAEKSLYEISQIQSQLASHLSTQNEMIEDLLNDAFQVHDDITSANQQLESAKTRNKRASKIIIYVSLFFAFLLLFYDAITY